MDERSGSLDERSERSIGRSKIPNGRRAVRYTESLFLLKPAGSSLRSSEEGIALMDYGTNPPSAPQPPPRGIAPAAPGGGVAESLIPYRNGAALTAYYLGVFSLACGALLGIPALILGIKGLKVAKERPEAHGQAHAWIGIVLGSIMTLVSLAVVAFFVLAARGGQ